MLITWLSERRASEQHEKGKSMHKLIATVTALGGILVASSATAEIKVGFVTALSGNGASIGIPYSKGIKAAVQHRSEIGGEKITVIELDDNSDPSTSTRNARK